VGGKTRFITTASRCATLARRPDRHGRDGAGSLVMERKMLLGIKQRAEALAAS
jgi:hypothetical protein